MTIDELALYYSNLLIAQYATKVKARGTITALAKEAAGDTTVIFPALRNAFNLETAVGVQLDMLGLLVGVKRYVYGADTTKTYFGMPRIGDIYNDFSGFASIVQPITGAYWERIADLSAYLGELDDDTFRRLIKYLILLNSMDVNLASIDWLFDPSTYLKINGNWVNTTSAFAPSINIWGSIHNPVYITDNRDMTITYTISANQTGPGLSNKALITAIKSLNAWPRPAGVTITIVG